MKRNLAWTVGLLGVLLLWQAAGADEVGEPLPENAAAVSELRTVGLLPFSNRAGAAHAHLAPAITLAAGHAVRERTSLVLLDRDRLMHVVDEHRLHNAGLVDAADAPETRMIPADALVYGYYEVVEGQLIIEAEVLPAGYVVAHGSPRSTGLSIAQVRARGSVDTAVSVMEQFGVHLAEQLLHRSQPRQRDADGADAIEPAIHHGTVAVFDLTASRSDVSGTGAASLFTQQLTLALAGIKGVQVVERERLSDVLMELERELSGMTAQGRAMLVGRLVGADYLTVGTLVTDAERRRVDIHLLDARRGVVVASAQVAIPDEADDISHLAQHQAAHFARVDRARTALLESLLPEHGSAHPEGVMLARRANAIQEDGRGEQVAKQAIVDDLIQAAQYLSPDAGWVSYYAGLVAYRQQQNEEARQLFQRAVDLLPGEPQPAYRLAMVYLVRRKEPAEAIPWFEQALDGYEAMTEHDMGGTNAVNAYYGQALHRVGQTQKAIEVLQRASEHWYSGGWKWRIYNRLGLIYWETERWLEAAEAYEQAGMLQDSASSTFNLQRAVQAYDRAGEPERALRALRARASLRLRINTRHWRRLAEASVVTDPDLAAEIAYVRPTRVHPESDFQWTADLLEHIGRPPLRPVYTGAVFDIDDLRRQDVFAYLQIYDTFHHAEALPYLKQHFEDMLGIPLKINDTRRPFPERTFRHDVDRFVGHDPFRDDLYHLADETGAVSVIGLTDIHQVDQISRRLGDATGTVSFYTSDHARRSAPIAETAFTYSVFAPQVIKVTGVGLLTTELPVRPDETHCVAHGCLFRYFRWDLRDRLPVPCDHCRNRLRQAHPEWKPGPDERDPLVAGPASPAVDNPAGYVLLIAGGLNADEAHLEAAARAVTLSTGLPVRLAAHPELPAEWRDALDDEWAFIPRERIYTWARNQVDRDDAPLAVCVLVNDNVQTKDPRGVPWTLEPAPSDDTEAPPVVTIALGSGRFAHMPSVHRLQLLEPVEQHGIHQTFSAPAYAKHLIAGLATLATDQQPCWTYGCPGTIWPFITDPARCSIWLCGSCRQAMISAFDNDP